MASLQSLVSVKPMYVRHDITWFTRQEHLSTPPRFYRPKSYASILQALVIFVSFFVIKLEGFVSALVGDCFSNPKLKELLWHNMIRSMPLFNGITFLDQFHLTWVFFAGLSLQYAEQKGRSNRVSFVEGSTQVHDVVRFSAFLVSKYLHSISMLLL